MARLFNFREEAVLEEMLENARYPRADESREVKMEEQEFELALQRLQAFGQTLDDMDFESLFQEIERHEYNENAELGAEKNVCRVMIKAKRAYGRLQKTGE